MIVVDINVVACYFIEGERTALAHELKCRDPDWRLPSLSKTGGSKAFPALARTMQSFMKEFRS